MSGYQGNDDDVADRDDDEQSIIDVFEFDDTNQDRWLCSLSRTSSRRSSVDNKVEDLDAWLHADLSESDSTKNFDNGSKLRNIDTRTFTRMKRRSNRLSFETLDSSASPEQFTLSNLWKNSAIPESPPTQSTSNNNNDKETNIQKERRDNIPMMLRPKTNQVLAALLSESPSSISSQTSMEAFMNMAHSKEGLNSLINDTSDPDVNHFLMNISQPSLLYSSIISDSKGDESVHAATVDSFVDSQILTDSMMEASMFKEVQDTTMIAEFLKQNDTTIVEDKTLTKCSNIFDDKTFTDFGDRTFINVTNKNSKSYNEIIANKSEETNNSTFINIPSPISSSKIKAPKVATSKENLLDATQLIATSNFMNSTKILQPALSKGALSTTLTIKSKDKTDVTFDLKYESLSPSEDVKSQIPNDSSKKIPQLIISNENNLNATFDAIPNLRAELLQEVQRSSGNKFDDTFITAQLPNTETKFDTTYDRKKTPEPYDNGENFETTYIQTPTSCQPESQGVKKCLDLTYNNAQINSQLSTASRMSYTKKNPEESQLDQNRFNTFRKDTKIGTRLSKVPQEKPTLLIQPQNVKAKDTAYQQRFNTFSKKMSIGKSNTFNEDTGDENKPDNTFIKPPGKIPTKQIQAPRQLSKLPQLFQKSNPNLGASVKPFKRLTLASDLGFNKGSQPNMYSLGRFKSEQRLLPSKQNSEFSISDGTSRSMESIDSTTSAHSAPDFDDRLSICSDISKASYTIKPRNLEALKSMDDQDAIRISTPVFKGHKVLENTWVEEKDLPSPILKNGLGRNFSQNGICRNSSPTNMEYNAKTSSPLMISPASSDPAVNTIGNFDAGIDVAKENIQVTENVKPRQIKPPATVSGISNPTKLRRPSNWTGGGNKVVNGAVSGIPRPASRIPAPKFARPNPK